jgi:hypothetical protein
MFFLRFNAALLVRLFNASLWKLAYLQSKSGTYSVVYGTVPAGYGTVLVSSAANSSTATGNAGSYAAAGDPDRNRPQNSTVTVAAMPSIQFRLRLANVRNRI